MSAFDPEVADVNDEVIALFSNPFEFFHVGPDVAFTICGVFTSASTREDSADQASFHRVFCRAADFTIPPRNGDLVRSSGKEYVVIDVKADHGGGILLILNMDSFV